MPFPGYGALTSVVAPPRTTKITSVPNHRHFRRDRLVALGLTCSGGAAWLIVRQS